MRRVDFKRTTVTLRALGNRTSSVSVKSFKRKSVIKNKRRQARAIQDIAATLRPSIDDHIDTIQFSDSESDHDSLEKDFPQQEEEWYASDDDFAVDDFRLDALPLQQDDEPAVESYSETQATTRESEAHSEELEPDEPKQADDVFASIQLIPEIEDLNEPDDFDPFKELRQARGSKFIRPKHAPKIGKFIDPLTGRVVLKVTKPDQSDFPRESTASSLTRDSRYSKFDETIQPKKKFKKKYFSDDEDEEEESEEDFSELFELDERYALEFGDVQKSSKDPETHDVVFKIPPPPEGDEKKTAETPKLSPAELLKQEEDHKLRASINGFLNKLITKAVKSHQKKAKIEAFRKSLNKDKLCRAIIAKFKELNIEKFNSFYQEKILVEFLKRKKVWSHLVLITAQPSQRLQEIYSNALYNLDQKLGKKKETKRKIREALARTRKEFQELLNRSEKAEEKFEQLVLGLVKRQYHDSVPKAAHELLSVTRREGTKLSELRRRLILNQHKLGVILCKAFELNQINDEIKLQDYERMRIEIRDIENKIEERDNDLRKRRARIHSAQHLLTHLREKKISAKNVLEITSEAYEELNSKVQEFKIDLYYLGMERIEIREVNQNLMVKGALMFKPDLLLEYDSTVEKINAKKQAIEGLKNELQDLRRKYGKLKEMCKDS